MHPRTVARRLGDGRAAARAVMRRAASALLSRLLVSLWDERANPLVSTLVCIQHRRRLSQSLCYQSVQPEGGKSGRGCWKSAGGASDQQPDRPAVTLGVVLFGGALISLRAKASEEAFHQTQPSVSHEALESAETRSSPFSFSNLVGRA